jgi:hypothetical protein
MEVHAAKTINDFREDCREAREFCATYDLHPDNAHSDLASIVLESLATTGSEALFWKLRTKFDE